ncbi:hypothetical protein B0H19DRAFT_1263414 [Mycena capillaripes]|nr:hypothetical protein B0H19DRAFT_1263414 [Mycena capillaripes]
MISLISAALLLFLPAIAQQVDSSWRKPNITVPRSDRIAIAEAAIEAAAIFLDTTNALFPDPGDSYGLAGAFYSQLAEFDLATQQTKYADDVAKYFLLAPQGLGQFNGLSNFTGELNYGHAAAVAYSTYKNPVFLQYAEQVWWAVNAYTLSETDLKTGTIPLKNFPLGPTCQGATMAGGTFRARPALVFEKDPASTTINTQATGNFLVLSALLAEATNDDLYLDAAIAAADFLEAHLSSIKHITQDSISARTNDSCAQAPSEFSEDSGIMIEGLAILYSISHNASIHDLIEDMLTAVIPYAGWQGSDGIIANGATKSGDLILPRALATVNARNATTPALQAYIDAYLSVQFNAVVDLATINGSNIYSGSWSGPPSLSFSPSNQTNALQVLLGAINVDNPPTNIPGSDPSDSKSPVPSTTPSPQKKSKIGPIVGGVLGGLLFLVVVVVAALLLRRRSRSRADLGGGPAEGTAPEVTQLPPTAITPFDTGLRPPPSSPGGSTIQGSTMQSFTVGTTSVSTGPSASGSSTRDESAGLLYARNNDEYGDLDEPPPDYRVTEFQK